MLKIMLKNVRRVLPKNVKIIVLCESNGPVAVVGG